MEHPLRSVPRHRRQFLALARALLRADESAEAHALVLRSALQTAPAKKSLKALSARTLSVVSTRPQPRLKSFAQRLGGDSVLKRLIDRHGLSDAIPALPPPRMHSFPGSSNQIALETVHDLADWLRLEPEHLLWFADLRDLNRSADANSLGHYTYRILAKPYGAIRLLEVPKQRLRDIQRQILDEILAPVALHPAVHGFCKGRSIVTFVSPHVGREAVLRLDLQDFFPSITGPRIQALFRTLGYPEPVADLLGGLCTTTTPRSIWRQTGLELSLDELQRARVLYKRPHLPQGAPTSPALSNLCAFRLDCRLGALAKAAGAAYTRYADDLAFSGDAPFARGAGRFARHIMSVVTEEGFTPHSRKTRLMRASVRQHLAGLTLNVRVGVPRQEIDRLEAILTNCVRLGPSTQNQEGHSDFARHLQGRVAFASMVNPVRSAHLRTLFGRIDWEA